MIYLLENVVDTMPPKESKMKLDENSMSDILADTSLYFRQIIALVDLMLANSNIEETPNLMTLKELAESGLNKIEILDK